MRWTSRWILILAAVLWAGPVLGAPPAAERRALAAAENSFQLGFWERAEKQFAAFAEKFPRSELRASAVLRQAQARCRQGRFSGAVELLAARQREAGALADEYQFWIGEAQFQSTNYPAAAEAYTRLVKDFPASPHVLEACYDAALARSRLGDWVTVAGLLRQPDGAFQKAAAASPANELAVRGLLLLGEAQLAQKDFAAAEEAVRPLAAQKLNPELEWRRQFLRGRIQLAADQPAEALAGVTNLFALAASAGSRELRAESALAQGGILERLKKFDEAVAAYELNLADEFPVERRRQAVLKIVELLLARHQTAAAAARLEKFFGQYGKDRAADTALLAAGELHLREFLANPTTNRIETAPTTKLPAFTNDLQQAFAQFDWIANNYPRSPVLGKALVNRGWCLWVAGQIAESEAAFQQAALAAALSEDQALARYKWADCQLLRNNPAGALANYSFVLDNFSSWPSVRDDLFEPALYQIARVQLLLNNPAGATNALARLLAWYPAGFLCDRGLLLAGEKFNRTGQPVAARKIFAETLQRFPQTPLTPDLRLAVARTYETEGNWPAAAAEYARWLADFPTNAAQPAAEFSRAWAAGQTGPATNALVLFTNFVARFPTNELTALAQNWVADYFWSVGDFPGAEKNYQLLYQNTNLPPSLMTYQARLMAGRAAAARLGYAEAIDYFRNLINQMDCPPELVAQAWFEYGDATMRLEATDTNKPLANYEEAIRIFNKIPQKFPANGLVAPAWGRIGDCCLQLASTDAKFYPAATNAYQQALTVPHANMATRSQAEVGLGVVWEKIAAQKTGAEAAAPLKAALDCYLDVALGANLRAEEAPDPFWMKKAGLEAGRLAEALGQWQPALKVYQLLATNLPPLQNLLEKRIVRVQERLAAGKN